MEVPESWSREEWLEMERLVRERALKGLDEWRAHGLKKTLDVEEKRLEVGGNPLEQGELFSVGTSK